MRKEDRDVLRGLLKEVIAYVKAMVREPDSVSIDYEFELYKKIDNAFKEIEFREQLRKRKEKEQQEASL